MLTLLLLGLGILPSDAPIEGASLLRYRFVAGTQQTLRVEQRTEVDDAAPQKLTMVLRQSVTEVREHEARLLITLERIEFTGGDRRTALYEALKGLSWRGWVTQTGHWKELSMTAPSGAPKLLRPVLDRLRRLPPGRLAILPEKPVAVGDTWQLSAQELARGGGSTWALPTEGSMVCKLVGKTAHRATIHLVLKASMGSSDRSRRGRTQGEGEMILDLRTGAIERINLRTEMTLDLTVGGAPKSHRLVNHFTMTTTSELP
jgi:hypothetical protein